MTNGSVEPDEKTLSRWLNSAYRKVDVWKDKSKFLRLALLRACDNDKEKMNRVLKETEDHVFRDL